LSTDCLVPIDPSKVLWIVVTILDRHLPCALGLATPPRHHRTAAHTRLGLLTTARHAWTLARATAHFDKTALSPTPASVRRVCRWRSQRAQAACGRSARKPSRNTHRQGLREVAAPAAIARQIRNTPGRGVEGAIEGRVYRLGAPAFAVARGLPPTPPEPDGGASWVALAEDGELIAWFALADTPRADAPVALAALQKQGLRLHLVSGDAAGAVQAVAQQLGIAEWHAGALPEDKLAYVNALQQQGRIVAMVGDGINDAPVLAGAQVSIAMGEGADVAQAAATW